VIYMSKYVGKTTAELSDIFIHTKRKANFPYKMSS